MRQPSASEQFSAQLAALTASALLTLTLPLTLTLSLTLTLTLPLTLPLPKVSKEELAQAGVECKTFTIEKCYHPTLTPEP